MVDEQSKGILVILVRHGESEGNSSGRLQLPSEQLSSNGLSQASRLGDWFKASESRGDFRVKTVVTSDYERTLQTTAGLMGGLDPEAVEVKREPLFQERNFGDLRGQFYKDVCAQFGDLFAPDFDPPGGESWEVFRRRVELAWSVLTDEAQQLPPRQEGEPEPALVIVTHGLVLRVISDTFLFPGGQVVNFRNTAMAKIRLLPQESNMEVSIETFNVTPHLDEEALDDPLLRNQSSHGKL
mmetsp:Transcript_78752/g.163816  ORF Transcript_78752/g.163816 Transcript_78752/m.163816 type:complete len:240 (-) Transcript_78752:139-858(-)